MPRYLVTLRHTETGETRDYYARGNGWGEAFAEAEAIADENYNADGDWIGGWVGDHACPADDVPVPGRDR